MRNIRHLLCIAGITLSGCFTTEETTVIKINEPITSIDALTDSGNLSFLPSPDGTIRIEQTFRFFKERPTASSGVVDGVLQLRGECPDPSFSCSVDFVVYTPTAISLLATSQSGNVEASQIEGPLTLTSNSGNISADGAINTVFATTDSGNVELSSIAGETTATSRSGNITLSSIEGDITAEASSGNVTFSSITGDVSVIARSGNVIGDNLASEIFDATVDSGNANVSFSIPVVDFIAQLRSGNVILDVPAAQYKIDAQSDSGNVNLNGVSNDSSAARSIFAHTNSGNVTINAR